MQQDQTSWPALLRFNRSLLTGLTAVILIVVLLVTLPPVTTFWTTELRDRLSDQIVAFEDLRLQIENDVQGMQAAQRGYLLTGQQPFLERYQTTAAKLPDDLEQLSRLAPLVDPILAPQVDELRARLRRWQQEGPDKQLELLAQDDLAGAIADVSTGQSQQRFDSALEQLRLLNTENTRIEAALTARINAVRRLETLLAFGLGALGIFLGGYLVLVFHRQARLAVAIEQERERAAQAMVATREVNLRLQREEQYLHAVFDQSPEGLLLLQGDNGTVILANHAARLLLDETLPAEQPLPSSLVALCFQPSGEQYPSDKLPWVRALVGEPAIGVEVVIEHRNGHRVPLLFNCVPLHDPAGKLRGSVAVFQDLTRFREVERLKSDFVALVSHELRTPLTAIQGCTQTLLHGSGAADPGRIQEFLEIIDTQSARLHELIDNLLDASQIEAGSLRLRTGPVQPGRLVRSVVRQAGERMPGLIVQADLPQPLPTVGADADRIEQVLFNLLDNARKFAPAGSVITVRAVPEPDVIRFSVRDQGPGIPVIDHERIFDRFYQSTPPSTGVAHGTGLGLAICKALVEAHGGQIWVDGEVTNGTLIAFTLPRTPALTETVDSPATPMHRAAFETAHILVVDDESAVRQMLVGSLRNAGYVAHAVAEGQAALEYVGAEQPDLVVLDLMLPGQDGFAILRQIRDWSNVLVLMLTASPESQNVVRGLQLGADDYVTKPFSMNEFLARVAALLRRRNDPLVPEAAPIFHNDLLQIDFGRRTVKVAGKPVDVTPTEFRLLAVLAHHAGQVLTHKQLLQQVWGPEFDGESQYLWVHIGRLRQKIELNPKSPQVILTERGVGYRMATAVRHSVSAGGV
ncbi:MAG: ATP-binding protein [Chloroflexota bacterium]|nr:ATP-binding protein [Chloroflexota bacterium]